MTNFRPKAMIYFLLTVLLICGFSAAAHAKQMAVVAAVAPDYTSGALSVIPVDPVDGSRTPQNELNETGSDITVAAYGDYFYLIERTGANSITKYPIDAPETVVWQYSTQGDESGSNPYDLIFANSKKAYLLRYGSTKAWIVNPSAGTQAGFKLGELDLGAYADTDGTPGMVSGTMVGDRLFVLLQRVDYSQYPDTEYSTPYVAVFDTATNTEIDTGRGGAMKGIEIPEITNTGFIQYLEANDTLYVQGVGDYDASTDAAKGGIVSLDPDTYETRVILTDENDGYGAVSGMGVVSETKGYFIGYAGWGDNTLYSFDPSCGCSIKAVPGLENKGLSGMEKGIYSDKNGLVWICNQTDARVDILDPTDDTIVDSVSTSLNPLKVAFTGSASSPAVPDIKVNGSDRFLGLKSTDNLSVTLELAPGDYAGDPAEWWLLADTPFGWFHYQPGDNTWARGFAPSLQSPLLNLGEFEVLNISKLPAGAYWLCFGVDMVMNGQLDMDQGYYDSAIVYIE